MSSYLSIYIVPKRKSKEEEKKHILLSSYSRNTDLYQYFNENIHPVFIGNSEKTPYTTLTMKDIQDVIKDMSQDILKSQNVLTEYEKYAPHNPEYIQDILETKEHISNLQYWKDKISFIEDMIDNIPYYEEIEEVCCNIS